MAVHHVSLRRPDPSYSWGFRLQGGVDYQLPLSVESVAPGTVADRCGLARGDFVVGINGQPTDYLQHEAAKMAIIRSGNEVSLTVRRGGGSGSSGGGAIYDDYESGGGGGGVSVWRPSVQSVTQLYQQHQQQQQQQLQQQATQSRHHATPARPAAGRFPTGSGSMFADLPKVTNTSLAANKSDTSMRHYDNNYNSSPRPFTPHGYAYGPSAVTRHRGGGGGGVSNNVHHQQQSSPHLHDSTNHGYRQVRPPEPGVPRPAPGAGGGGLICAACGDVVRGVFVNVQGRLPMHPECLKCVTCGMALRHVGYYCVEDRVYCEAHARAATAGGLFNFA